MQFKQPSFNEGIKKLKKFQDKDYSDIIDLVNATKTNCSQQCYASVSNTSKQEFELIEYFIPCLFEIFFL